MTYENLIYTGDFNIHVNNSQDADSMQFRDMIEAWVQNINFPTHKQGNTLDLLLTEANSAIKLNKIDPGPFISDHRLIVANVNFHLDRTEPKMKMKHEIINTWI